jgi:hypothetical protein
VPPKKRLTIDVASLFLYLKYHSQQLKIPMPGRDTKRLAPNGKRVHRAERLLKH